VEVFAIAVGRLTAGGTLEDMALDKYVLIRDAHLSRRRSGVYDGDPPEIPEPTDEPPAAPK